MPWLLATKLLTAIKLISMRKYSFTYAIILLLSFQTLGTNCSGKKTPETRIAADTVPGKFTPITLSDAPLAQPSGSMDFVTASRMVTPGVVHIKTLVNASVGAEMQMYGQPYSRQGRGSGSGVIITENGFIATNNHVIENASEIQVILPDKRVFKATLVGRDPNTDLALIKVSATGLPILKFGNSDKVEVGQWVLAVGYPFSLNTTVTAGIVSAKARSIGIIQRSAERTDAVQPGSSAIESFIQTDAAINPGNSGGALVNTSGELVGINSAIASQTGSYAGYAFAIPANLAKKILEDLQRYGSVKRGILGVSFPAPSVEDQYLQQKGLVPGSVNGVYITGVLEGGAAAAAGLKEGDIIQSIDGVPVTSSSEFSERIARRRPGDKTALTYLRNGKVETASVVLKSEEIASTEEGNPASLQDIYNRLGAKFEQLPPTLKERYNLENGVVVSEVLRGGFFDQVGIPAGSIIAFINGKAISSPKDIDAALISARRGVIQIFAIAPDGSRVVFNFSLGT